MPRGHHTATRAPHGAATAERRVEDAPGGSAAAWRSLRTRSRRAVRARRKSARRQAHEPRRALRLSLLLLALVPRLSRSWQCASRSALPRLALPRRSILSPSLLRPRAPRSPALLAKKGKKGGGGKKGGKGKAKSGFEWASSFELKPFESAELRSLAETLVSTYQV